MFIYKIKNNNNGKVYIGQTIRPVEARFNRHMNDAENNILDTHFARAIRKYGRDSFSVEVIDTATNQDELTQKERYWIGYYNSINKGYNETDAANKCGGNTYASKSDNEVQEISDKIRLSKLGCRNPNRHPVKCKNCITGNELFFDTVEECRKYFGEKTHRFLSTRLTFQTKSLYRGEWMFAYADKEYQNFVEKVPKRGKELRVFSMEDGSETIYKSIHAACTALKIRRDRIMNAIKTKKPIENMLFTEANEKCIDYP